MPYKAPSSNRCLSANRPTRTAGFTFVEVITSVAVFSLVLMLATGIYSLAQRQYQAADAQNELWQNVRVIFDRITREVRQANAIATDLPATQSGAPHALLFQDGHETTDVRYIRYRLDNTSVIREVVVYTFPTNPGEYVLWNAQDQLGNPPDEAVLETQLVGEHVTDIDFWRTNNLVHIEAWLEKNDEEVEIMTSVYGRNL